MDNEPTHVLVIDSDTVRRGMLACALPPAEYVIEFAKAAEAGLDLLGRLRPAVVLVGLDGSTADLCQRIRLLPAGGGCLLLLLDERLGEPGEPEVVGADVAFPIPFDLGAFEVQLERHQHRPLAETRQLPIRPGDEATGRVPSAARPSGRPAAPAEQILDQAAAPAGEEVVVSEEAAWAAFRTRVDYLHQHLADLDYFQLLDVPRGATLTQIKDAYFQRSMEFHPDRFMRLEDEELKVRNYEIYKRMTEAFRVLTQPESRAAYIHEDLEAPAESRSMRYTGQGDRRTGDDRWCQALTSTGSRYLRFAELAYQSGNLRSATKYLALAADWEPDNQALHQQLAAVAAELSS